MEKKKLKLSIAGSTNKTINSIEQAKNKSKNTVVIEKKTTRFSGKSQTTRLTSSNDKLKNNEIPKSGLNFLVDNEKKFNSKFLLLCGFEKFKNFYVRVDILEKLFLNIIENTKNGKFKINSDMMNLLGCSKENFFQLVNLLQLHLLKKEVFHFLSSV